MNGVVVVDKPGGMTSHDVVNRLRRIYGTRKVGHAGTLDPLATGVLVVCIGQATRILEYLSATRKGYRAGVLFGVTTDSQDITGQELCRRDPSALSREDVEAALRRFRGEIRQVPPMHSALHHEGKRLYELARQGVEVDREARPIEIHRLDLVEFAPGPRAHAVIDVECSSGTYIRTLAADIGDAAGTGAVMDALRRTRVGAFNLEQARTLEDLAERKESARLGETLRSMKEALADWPHVPLTDPQISEVRHGRCIHTQAQVPAGNALLVDQTGEVIALARVTDGTIAPFKVFSASD